MKSWLDLKVHKVTVAGSRVAGGSSADFSHLSDNELRIVGGNPAEMY